MNSGENCNAGPTRRKFIKELAVGSSAIASAGALIGWTANASPVAQGVSKETSDGKIRYGKSHSILTADSQAAMRIQQGKQGKV